MIDLRCLRAAGVLGVALVAASLAGCNPASRYGPLQQEWSQKTAGAWGPIAAKPAVDSDKAYIGSWTGNEFAFDQATGALRWQTFLGQSGAYCPQHDTLGVTSSPWLQDGAAYLGGGDAYWYALDTSSGGVLWRIFTGDSSETGGHYNWSSPIVYNGHAYIGIASHCDSPLVQGKLLRVNLQTHQVANQWKAVPDGQVGGTIWTSPVLDAARNTVFVTTGNRAYDATGATQQYAEAMVALDAGTLAVKGAWSLPVSDPTPDADWGTSPTLFRDAFGRDLVSGANKNGILYAFLRDNVGAGPV